VLCPRATGARGRRGRFDGCELNRRPGTADDLTVDASAYALTHGVRTTRAALADWNKRPWPLLGRWVLGSLAAACVLLVGVLGVSMLAPSGGHVAISKPPLKVGGALDVLDIFLGNLKVLGLHVFACVAGFMAGSSLPMQAKRMQSGFQRFIHERGARFAILFVVTAIAFSLSIQAWVIGSETAKVAHRLSVSPALLLLTLLPHAIPELTALFLPLAAWIIASRAGDWDKLLAAALVTGAIALPVLIVTALWEVYLAPHVIGLFIHVPSRHFLIHLMVPR
jgi:hypothetical protein